MEMTMSDTAKDPSELLRDMDRLAGFLGVPCDVVADYAVREIQQLRVSIQRERLRQQRERR